jgi:outer membrane immunogenic protein
MFQRVILTSVSVIALSASVFADGLSSDAPPAYTVQTWRGFYFGAGGGGGSTNHNLRADLHHGATANLTAGGAGGFSTAQVGYDRQIGRHLVVGLFFDYDFASIDSSANIASYKVKATLTDSWTVGGRAGYLVNPSTLVYGLAGHTEAHFDLPLGLNGDFNGGWTAGAGIETNLGGNLFLKGEYRVTQLDEKTLYTEPSYVKITDQADIQTGRLVLTYKVNSAGSDPFK